MAQIGPVVKSLLVSFGADTMADARQQLHEMREASAPAEVRLIDRLGELLVQASGAESGRTEALAQLMRDVDGEIARAEQGYRLWGHLDSNVRKVTEAEARLTATCERFVETLYLLRGMPTE